MTLRGSRRRALPLYAGSVRSLIVAGSDALVLTVVHDANVAVVDRRYAVLRVELEIGAELRGRGRHIWHKDAGIERTRQEGVVHAVQRVAQRIVLGQDRLVDHGSCVAALEHVELDARLGFEVGDDGVAGSERVVGDERYLASQRRSRCRRLARGDRCARRRRRERLGWRHAVSRCRAVGRCLRDRWDRRPCRRGTCHHEQHDRDQRDQSIHCSSLVWTTSSRPLRALTVALCSSIRFDRPRAGP